MEGETVSFVHVNTPRGEDVTPQLGLCFLVSSQHFWKPRFSCGLIFISAGIVTRPRCAPGDQCSGAGSPSKAVKLVTFPDGYVDILTGKTFANGQSMRKRRIKYLLPPSPLVRMFRGDDWPRIRPSHEPSFFVRYAPIDR
jgi:hypothetical protein